MNESPYINTKHCGQCGLCCKSFQIGYSKTMDKDLLSEVERFKLLDTDLIEVKEDEKGYWIEFKIPCKHFKESARGCYCDIYARDRPLLCRQYPHKTTTDCPHKKQEEK